MRKKNTIRLNESQLRNMISESVKQVLSERYITPDDVLDFEDLGVTPEEYRKLVDYDDNCRQEKSSHFINPTLYSYLQYKDNFAGPKKYPDVLKRYEQGQYQKMPSNDNINHYIERNNSNLYDSDTDFRNSYINDDKFKYDAKAGKAISDLEKMNKKRIHNSVKNRRTNRKDYNKANERFLHRKGSLNREI